MQRKLNPHSAKTLALQKVTTAHFFNGRPSLFGGKEINFVQHDDHFLTRYFPDNETFRGLRLDSFGDVHHEHHHVYYLGP